MDMRLVIVFLPLIVASSWAIYNIGRVAIQQFRSM
nr:photosystem II protein Y [Pterosiphonia complanata]WAX03020.1 photosystem II protein Y [Pterosiphonia complanata]